eukprot:COSAG05_NODE_6_length_45604_cov_26.489660_8_plen_59_part_00
MSNVYTEKVHFLDLVDSIDTGSSYTYMLKCRYRYSTGTRILVLVPKVKKRVTFCRMRY